MYISRLSNKTKCTVHIIALEQLHRNNTCMSGCTHVPWRAKSLFFRTFPSIETRQQTINKMTQDILTLYKINQGKASNRTKQKYEKKVGWCLLEIMKKSLSKKASKCEFENKLKVIFPLLLASNQRKTFTDNIFKFFSRNELGMILCKEIYTYLRLRSKWHQNLRVRLCLFCISWSPRFCFCSKLGWD